MAKILITGANGFAGPYVAEALARRGHEIHGITKEPDTMPDGAIARWHVADLKDPGDTMQAVAEARPDAVVHLAGISFVAHSDVGEIYANNICGTRNLLEAIARLGGMTGPTVIISSGNVYGNRISGAMHEDLPLRPLSDYAISKVACEHLAYAYLERVNSFVVRPFNYTGVGQSPEFLIPKIANHVRDGAKVIELGNVAVARDFSDVRYFAECLARLIALPVNPGDTVNICSGRAHSLLEVLDIFARISGRRMEIVSNAALMRANEVERMWGDATKLQNLIGPIECPPLEETLRWILASDHAPAPSIEANAEGR